MDMKLANALLLTIAETKDVAPSGHLYAALTTQGVTLDQYQVLIGAFEKSGLIRRDGDVIHPTKKLTDALATFKGGSK